MKYAAAAAVAVLPALMRSRRSLGIAAAGMLLMLLRIGIPCLFSDASALETLLPGGRPRSVSAELLVTDTRVSGVAELPVPSFTRAELLKISGSAVPERFPRNVMISWGGEHPCGIACGDILIADGVLSPASPGYVLFNGGVMPSRGFRTADKLEADGCRLEFKLRRFRRAGGATGWRPVLCGWRDRLLGELLRGISDRRAAGLCAALFFGISGGVDRESGRNFFESGTIHLFSVSGMHVGTLALLLLFILRPVRSPHRYRILLALLTLYVITTGANPPAVRALLLIAVTLLAKSGLRWIPCADALAAAAASLLLFNPGWFGDTGFQYSFVITGILLAGSAAAGRLERLAGESFRCMPGDFRRAAAKRSGIYRRMVMPATACIIAFCGGAGISTASRGRFLLWSVPVNLILLAAGPPLWLLALVKLTAGRIPAAGRVCAALLEYAFRILVSVTGMAAELGRLPAVRPGTVETVLFYAVLFAAAVLFFRCRYRLLYAGLLFLLLFFPFRWCIAPYLQPPVMAIGFGGGEPVPSLLLCPPGGGNILINAPGGGISSAWREFLLDRGVTSLESVYLTSGKKAEYAGIRALCGDFHIGEIILPRGTGKRLLRNAAAELADTGIPVRAASETSALISEKNGFSFVYSGGGFNFNDRNISVFTDDGGCHLSVSSGKIRSLLLPYSNLAEISCREW